MFMFFHTVRGKFGKTLRFIRKCGYHSDIGCKLRHGYFGIKYTYCQCRDGDGCNKI